MSGCPLPFPHYEKYSKLFSHQSGIPLGHALHKVDTMHFGYMVIICISCRMIKKQNRETDDFSFEHDFVKSLAVVK